MKKLINDPKTVVDESVEGFGMAHPGLVTVTADPLFVVRAAGATQGKVGIVSGGGSGHEPLHAGFVGYGMLSAAVPGAVFTSPTPDPIVAATLAVDGGAGVLHIVKNYTGDVLNFETAADLADAEAAFADEPVTAEKPPKVEKSPKAEKSTKAEKPLKVDKPPKGEKPPKPDKAPRPPQSTTDEKSLR